MTLLQTCFPTPPGHSQPYLLRDGLRIIWTQRVIDGHKVVRAVVLDVEKRESDRYGFVLRGSDLPLTPRLGGVAPGVTRRGELLHRFLSLQVVETLLWERQHGLHIAYRQAEQGKHKAEQKHLVILLLATALQVGAFRGI